jgi:putative DNA primase/helicase
MGMIDAALNYARRGIHVFPCAKKIPLTGLGGFKNASTDADRIRGWWIQNPAAQIGLPTGQINHLFVIDIDGLRGAEIIKNLHLPETFTVETRPNRWQLWFRQPDGITGKCNARQLGPEVDIRSDGGYVVAPPSVHHETGQPYRVVKDLPWADVPIASLQVNGAQPEHVVAADMIPKGRRHQTMLQIAGALRARGLAQASVLDTLNTVNLLRCRPPLETAELEKLATYVGSKPAGFRGSRPMETPTEVLFECFADIAREEIDWLWPRVLPAGFLTLFVGDPGRGKSLATVDLAARISRGDVFPDGTRAPLGDVIFLSAEDSAAQVIGPRLDAAGANSKYIHRVKSVRVTLADGQTGESFFSLDRDLETLEQNLKKIPNPKLLVIDPLSAYLGDRIDAHKDAEVRRVLSPLAELSEHHRLGLIGIMHLRKTDTSALLRVSGSIGFAAAARVVWGFGKNPDNGAPCMVAVKNNLAPLGEGMTYSVETVGKIPRFVWGDSIPVFADEVLSNEIRDRHTTKRDDAEDWLHELLSNGPMPQQQIESKAKSANFSWATIRRAKTALGIKSSKASFGGGWIWELGSN